MWRHKNGTLQTIQMTVLLEYFVVYVVHMTLFFLYKLYSVPALIIQTLTYSGKKILY